MLPGLGAAEPTLCAGPILPCREGTPEVGSDAARILPMRPPRARTRALRAATLAACGVVLAACATAQSVQPAATLDASSGAPGASARSASDPAAPTGWGPTVGELAAAQELVRNWTPAQLAGQVIVGRWQGTDPAEAARLVADLDLAGVQLTGTNIVDADQVRAVTTAVTAASAATGRDFPPVIAVDQEGGEVAHLAGVAVDLPPFSVAGRAVVAPSGGEGTVQSAMSAVALELRSLGFTWVFAPDADVAADDGSTFIGDRAASGDAATASRAVAAAVNGYTSAGMACTLKHFPGHGGTSDDSHQVLPRIDASLTELQARELLPFQAGIAAGAPGVMVGHLDVGALESGVASSMSAPTYRLLRDQLHFNGVAITDSLGMGAVMERSSPAVDALKAGADLLLMPADTRLAHAQVTAAIASGEVGRAQVEQAAARVVALQHWQQRAAAAAPVPADATAQAAARVGDMRAAADDAP